MARINMWINNVRQNNKYLLLFYLTIAMSVLIPDVSFAVYDVPNDNSGCPGNCRQIPWRAGSDIWNNGSLPNYPSVTCTGLTEGDGTTDNSSAIQTCINNAITNTAVYIPAGIYYVNGTLTMKNSIVLRGAGSGSPWLPNTSTGTTTLKLGTSGWIKMKGGDGTNITKGNEVLLSSGYTKGSTQIVTSSAHGLSANDFIVIYEHPDTEIPVTSIGAYGDCTWCGESNASSHLMSQFVQVTSVVNSTTINISRPLYYTFKSTLSPGLKKASFLIQYAGVENIKIHGWSNSIPNPLIGMAGALFCWVKNAELYHDSDTAKAFPIIVEHAYGNEIRDNYIHGQRATQSDRAYGVGFMYTTSDNKVENNTIREQRHGLAQEGGGSGNVFLYNYVDDLYYIYDMTWIDSTRWNHGAHPYMTLVEGNIISRGGVDVSWGSSSHGLWFRNWFWGDLTGNYSGYDSTHPNVAFSAVRIDYHQNYFSLVGNVLGITGLHTTWSNATMHPTNCNGAEGTRSAPTIYWVGCDDNGGSYNGDAWNTLLKHGNFDYKTNGVAHWDGGSDHAIKNSMYYNAKPAFFKNYIWPPFGPDIIPITGKLPAKDRYEGNNIITPSPPTILRFIP